MVATYIGFFHFKLIRNGLKHNKRNNNYCQEYLWKRVFKFNSERVNVQHYITNHEHFVQCHNHLHMSLLIAFAAHLFKRLSSQAKMNRLTWYEYFINDLQYITYLHLPIQISFYIFLILHIYTFGYLPVFVFCGFVEHCREECSRDMLFITIGWWLISLWSWLERKMLLKLVFCFLLMLVLKSISTIFHG